MIPVAKALLENSRYTQFWRRLLQISRYIPAAVKQNAASIDQRSVIQLIGTGETARS
jgi:hypothetical protein